MPSFPLAARLLFWPAALFAAVMALLPRPPAIPTAALGDKWEHALAFAVLTLLAQSGLGAAPGGAARWRVAERLSFFGALIEVAQSVPALHRDCDLRDWMVDTVVVVLVTAGFALADRRARRRDRR